VIFRRSSQRMFGTLFQFRIAFKTSAFVRFFCGAARCTRLSTNSGPFRSHTNTSPGAAPGSTTRFLLSAVNVIVGLSHAAKGSQRRSAFNPVRNAKHIPDFALRANLVSCRPVQIWQLHRNPLGAARFRQVGEPPAVLRVFKQEHLRDFVHAMRCGRES
jgi:hypothetical protein